MLIVNAIVALVLCLSMVSSLTTYNVVRFNHFSNTTVNVKEVGTDRPKPVRNATSVKNGDLPKGVDLGITSTPGLYSEKGYLIETTRHNDCTGTVHVVAGLLTGAVNLWWSSRNPRFIPTPKFFIGADGQKYYQWTRYAYNNYNGYRDLDGYGTDFTSGKTYIYDYEYYGYGPSGYVDAYFPRLACSLEPDSYYAYIPHSYRLAEQGGFSYSRNYFPSSFHHVTDGFSGLYYLFYGSLKDCQVGLQPNAFVAYLIKDQCYFDPSSYGFGVSSKVHSWLKVVGYDKEEQTLTYSIHDNDDCEDRDPYKKAKKHTVSITDQNGVSVNSDCYNNNDKDYNNDFSVIATWVKLRVF